MASRTPEPLTRRTWLLMLLAFVLMWAWVLESQRRIEAQHPATAGQRDSRQGALSSVATPS
jgi:hypothetical protein